MKKIWIGLAVGLGIALLFLITLGQAATQIANNMAIVAQAQAVQSQADALQTQAWALVMSQCISGFILVIGTLLAFAGGFGGFYLYHQWQMSRRPPYDPSSSGLQRVFSHGAMPKMHSKGIPPGAIFLSGNRIVIPGIGLVQLSEQEARELAALRQAHLPALQAGQRRSVAGTPEDFDDPNGQDENIFSGWSGM
jgi:hypothetical protein